MEAEEISKLIQEHLPGWKLLPPAVAQEIIPYDTPKQVICPSVDLLRQHYIDVRMVDKDRVFGLVKQYFPKFEPEVEVSDDPEYPHWTTACVTCFVENGASTEEGVSKYHELINAVTSLELKDKAFWRFRVGFLEPDAQQLIA